MKYLILALCLSLSACVDTSTTVYHANGTKALHAMADAEDITWRPNYFHAGKLNHSNPTKAGGKAVEGVIRGAGKAGAPFVKGAVLP